MVNEQFAADVAHEIKNRTRVSAIGRWDLRIEFKREINERKCWMSSTTDCAPVDRLVSTFKAVTLGQRDWLRRRRALIC